MPFALRQGLQRKKNIEESAEKGAKLDVQHAIAHEAGEIEKEKKQKKIKAQKLRTHFVGTGDVKGLTTKANVNRRSLIG